MSLNRRYGKLLTACLAWLVLSALEALGGQGLTAGGQAVYRFRSPEYSTYYYASSELEKETLLYLQSPFWLYECVAWQAFPASTDPNLRPVYRLWSDRLWAHAMAIDGASMQAIMDAWDDWRDQGIAFYAYPEGMQPADARPVYSLWSESLRCPLYTASSEEKDRLLAAGGPSWQYRGVAWYVRPFDPQPQPTVVKGPYFLRPGPDCMTVAWQTDLPAVGRVSYGRQSTSEFWAQDPNLTTVHLVTLTGLEPNTPYVFDLTPGGSEGSGRTFRTVPGAGQLLRFVVYGDTRSLPENHATVIRGIVNSRPQVVFHVGDLVGDGGDYDSWGPEFFVPASPLMQQVPLVPVAGNHEYWGTDPCWFHYFFNFRKAAAWWALTCGPVRFIGLDSNVSYAPGSDQYEWLLAELQSPASKEALWRIVLLHHPPYTCSVVYSDDKAVQEHLVPLFDRYGVSMVFAGHTHAYERYQRQGIYYIVTGGGGGPLYRLANDTVPPIREFGLTAYHHCVIEADPISRLLRLAATDTEGKVFDTVEVPAGADTAAAEK
jgi:predicted phosphodiesterase